MRNIGLIIACLVPLPAMPLFAQSDGPTYADIAAGLADPERWLTYSGDYSGRRHSPLTQITPENVNQLRPIWTFQTGTTTRGRGFEASALTDDGVLYVTGSNNFAWAIDARSGRAFWSYRRDLPDDLTYGASAPVNRGFGMLGNTLFMVTLDAHLLALDRRNGDILWDATLADYRIGYAATLAPLVIDDKVIVGISGGEYPTRGFIDAYAPATGERLWRFNTIPGPGEPGSETWPADPAVLARGGGGTWMNGSYDPELNLIYWGVGNPNPDYFGDLRPGDNLYSNSLVALDADSGELRWEFTYPLPTFGGVMSTASGLVFTGDLQGNFMAFDAAGGNLWHYQTGSRIWGAAATTFMLDGRQIVLIPSGTTLTAFALPE